jgi:radical SAM-linked protein
MKVFERAIRRTGLPIAYSQGFNPHPQMVFGLPLSVGVTSEAEYADFDLVEPVEPKEFIDRMNRELPDGILLTDARDKISKGNIMASVSGAVYEIMIFLKENISIQDTKEMLDSFLKRDSIPAKKEGKGGVREIDIKPMIHNLDLYPVDELPMGYEEFGTAFRIKALLAAGSVSNLKPELLTTAFAEDAGIKIGASRINRKSLYIGLDGKMVDPLDERCL